MVSRKQCSYFTDGMSQMNRVVAAGLGDFGGDANDRAGRAEQPDQQRIDRVVIQLQLHGRPAQSRRAARTVQIGRLEFSGLWL